MNSDNISTLEKLSYRRLRLSPEYKIINSNYIFGQYEGGFPYLKHRTYRQQLQPLIDNSDGGAILITGLRGVGKSTMVHNAVAQVNEKGNHRIFAVHVVLPTEKNYDQMLVEIIRKLYELLVGDNIYWNELDFDTQNRIKLAYNRTRLHIKQSANTSLEGEGGLQLPFNRFPSLKFKGGHQQSEEESYLKFAAEDAEYELIQCIEALIRNNRRNRVVVIIDEIDKITSNKEGMAYFERCLERMKNLISCANALFIFVAGIDVYKRWEKDSQKINSLYDSLFDNHIYLPCIWDSAEEIFDVIEDREYVYKPVRAPFRELVSEDYTTIIEPAFQMLADYILFKGKGLPRKMLRTFNEFVVWDGEVPCFQMSGNRLRAISQINNLMVKFRTFTEEENLKTLFERDIYYSLFLSMLDILLSTDEITFSEEEMLETLLDPSEPMQTFFRDILQKLLHIFTDLSFIKEDHGKYTITDNTILNRDYSFRVLDQDLIIHEQSDESLLKYEDTSVDERFHNQIKLLGEPRLITFWEDYKAERLLFDTPTMLIFWGKMKSAVQKYAVIYKRKEKKPAVDEEEAKENLYLYNMYRFSGPYFLDTVDHLDSGKLAVSLRTPVNGYALTHLLHARLKMKVIHQVIVQILSMLSYLHKNGFGNLCLNPDNIMLCENGTIKIIDLGHLVRLGQRKTNVKLCTNRIYTAPEVYLSVCDQSSDYYSAGILLAEMITGKQFVRLYNERHIDMETVLLNEDCSLKLKKVLIRACEFDPGKRYDTADEMLMALGKCPEFRSMRYGDYPQSKNETVFGNDIKSNITNTINNIIPPHFPQPNMDAYKMNSIQWENEESGETTIIGDAYFDVTQFTHLLERPRKSRQAYLIRRATNERIVLDKPLFVIGKDPNRTDYCISDNRVISRCHAAIVQKDGLFYIIDYGASNGTYVNSEKIPPHQEYNIKHGDQIRLANEEFWFNDL